jgi:hypothetical protein
MSGFIIMLSLYAFTVRALNTVVEKVRRGDWDGLINSGPSFCRFNFQDQIQHFQTF